MSSPYSVPSGRERIVTHCSSLDLPGSFGDGAAIYPPYLLSLPSILQIYDLSADALSPTFYFLLPSSKIRDVTFLFNEEGKNIIVIMSSAGYIYTQLMEEASSAQQGPFYVTNVLEVNHEDLKVRANVAISFYSRFN